MRIWIGYDKYNPFYSYATQMKLWIHSASSGGSEKVYTLSSNGGTFYNTSEEGNTTSDSNVDKVDSETEHSGHRRYDYFDIDTSCFTQSWYLTVQKFEGNTWKGSTNSFQLTTDNANKCYCLEECMFALKTENIKQSIKYRTFLSGEKHPMYGKGYLISGEKHPM